ncbi:MAG TPA: hypothetical protein VNY56_03440 [Methylomirabilota bacterium]|nr:hypothetical protein [Methylomirabilota bacterium]
MSKAAELKEKIDQLEAERLILTIELRTELLRAAKDLLPEAIRQAKPREKLNLTTGKKSSGPGSPALLRLITRLAMRNIQIEKREK